MSACPRNSFVNHASLPSQSATGHEKSFQQRGSLSERLSDSESVLPRVPQEDRGAVCRSCNERLIQQVRPKSLQHPTRIAIAQFRIDKMSSRHVVAGKLLNGLPLMRGERVVHARHELTAEQR